MYMFSSVQFSRSVVSDSAYLCLFIYISTYIYIYIYVCVCVFVCHLTDFSHPPYEGGLYFPYTGEKIETKFKQFVEGNRDYETCLARHSVK